MTDAKAFPDRIDVDHRLAPHCRVLCDGKELRHCISADRSAGWALVYAVDEEGQFIITDGSIERVTVNGVIAFEWTD